MGYRYGLWNGRLSAEAVFEGAITGSGIASGTVAGPGSHIGVNADGGFVLTDSDASSVGDFSGPGSSTDNAIVRFDGTAGKTGQNSAVVVNDNGSLSGSGEIFGYALRTSGSLKVANISGSGEVFGTSVRTSGSVIAGSVSGSAISASTTVQGQISGSSMINHWVVVASGNKNLTAAESGKNIFMAAQTTASLPSPDTIGLNYHIIASQGFSNNPIKITASSHNDNLYGSFVSADGGTNDTADNAHDGIQFTSASVRGDSLTIISNGSKWFVRGVSEKSGAIQYQTGPNP